MSGAFRSVARHECSYLQPGTTWIDATSKPEAIAWGKSFIAVIDALQAYVKQYHTTGVAWNAKVSFSIALLCISR